MSELFVASGIYILHTIKHRPRIYLVMPPLVDAQATINTHILYMYILSECWPKAIK